MNHLALEYARRQLDKLQRQKLRRIAKDLREANRRAEPMRKIAADRRAAGVAGDGFVMKPC